MEKMRLIHPDEFQYSNQILQYLLFFDKLGLCEIGGLLIMFDTPNSWEKQPFLKFRQEGLIIFSSFHELKEEIQELHLSLNTNDMMWEEALVNGSMRIARIALARKYDVSTPTSSFLEQPTVPTRKENVASLVLKKLPILNLGIAPERLIDFKKDPDSKLKLAALRNWMNKVSYTQFTQNEIEDEFEYLLMQYQDHMDRAKLKYTLGSAEFWITAVPEIMNDLAHLKLGSTAKALFGFAKKELMLMEEERKAPGKELAFVYKAQQQFRD